MFRRTTCGLEQTDLGRPDVAIAEGERARWHNKRKSDGEDCRRQFPHFSPHHWQTEQVIISKYIDQILARVEGRSDSTQLVGPLGKSRRVTHRPS